MKSTFLPWLTLLSTIFMLMACIFIVSFVGFKVTDGMSAPPVPLYLEPAGYAFIIWFFIYLGFLALGIYQVLPRSKDDIRLVRSRKYIIFNSLLNVSWFYGVLSNQLWITLICMFGLLYTLICLSHHLELGKAGKDRLEKLSVKLPLALYFAWITVATPINFTSFLLVDLGWTGQASLGPELWTVLVLLIAFFIFSSLLIQKLVNITYGLVAVWAFLAIFVANRPESQLVGQSAILLASALVIILWRLSKKGKRALVFL